MDITTRALSLDQAKQTPVAQLLGRLARIDLQQPDDAILAGLRAATQGDEALFSFLRSNLRVGEGGTKWRCNIDAILAHYELSCGFAFTPVPRSVPLSLIYGAKSDFVSESGLADMARYFSCFDPARHAHRLDAGHLVHAERPAEVLQLIRDHLRASED